MKHAEVLIVGAGPTGLVLALWLSRQGIAVRIIDKTTEPGTTSRALAVQARTLELYRQLDLSDAVVGHGHKVPAVNFWVKGEQAARLSLADIGQGLTPYAFMEIFPQDQHEQLLVERLQALGVTVERSTELLGFADIGNGVSAQLHRADGSEESLQVAYLAGCDGARSTVRKALDIGYPGGTYQQIFYVADVQASGPAINGELHVDLDDADFLAVFPLAGTGRARLIGTVRDERAEASHTLQFEDVSSRAIEHMRLEVEQVNWFSSYRVHHRVADSFRSGRVFLLGDAAHVHSPAGGQGMNTGIGDAINLAWKLAAVLRNKAEASLLGTYEAERIGFARRLVATTDRAFSFATADGWIANLVRTRLAPLVVSRVASLEMAREFLFRTVSQITLNYRGMPLSMGIAGEIQGGDRLPWAADAEDDNFASLVYIGWQVHVYGSAGSALTRWCEERLMPLHVFEWRPVHEGAGLVRNAVYLLRPDSYIALAEPLGSPGGIERYFEERGIRYP
ncbi:FAD-dependent monooxygenase [Pseudomonas gingeri]|uniref:FAD-dependent monooxygenase n=1 Tax=Pseudomonas gingeri TaxID=117681 RepID=UPI0015B8F559|nr:FAD-dependent monooxygenase [Pseudomonas gingeri]NWD46500.1 FAD-dependent monooxygenase [Pseudomonas gingeri]